MRHRIAVLGADGRIEVEERDGTHQLGVDEHLAARREVESGRSVLGCDCHIGIDDVPSAAPLVRVDRDDEISARLSAGLEESRVSLEAFLDSTKKGANGRN